ncbi:universal stress protein [Caenimonas koreensis DSM 17982]|uniref:Universal stress protein n=1 Tax=Caenimonas koreensis DSM 17982 TaxID=1121255 RepID=A0A844BBM8_9BURK|nr:universal stress protein [Caenimonas koreensis]MRD47911.1 universal stress protein [Caenimonas koreensis DSM 17982]
MFKRILVPIDGSPTSNKALVAALNLARDAGASIRLVHTLDQLVYLGAYDYNPNLLSVVREDASRVLADALAIAQAAGVEADTVLIDDPGQRLGISVAEEAKKFGADLIVVGTHGRRGAGRVLLGSGAEEILRLAPVPVLTVRSEEDKAA